MKAIIDDVEYTINREIRIVLDEDTEDLGNHPDIILPDSLKPFPPAPTPRPEPLPANSVVVNKHPFQQRVALGKKGQMNIVWEVPESFHDLKARLFIGPSISYIGVAVYAGNGQLLWRAYRAGSTEPMTQCFATDPTPGEIQVKAGERLRVIVSGPTFGRIELVKLDPFLEV